MTSWENRIRKLVYLANPNECELVNESRANNLINSDFISYNEKVFARDDYVYVVFNEQNPEADYHPDLSTATAREAWVSDWAKFTEVEFRGQPPLPPVTISIPV